MYKPSLPRKLLKSPTWQAVVVGVFSGVAFLHPWLWWCALVGVFLLLRFFFTAGLSRPGLIKCGVIIGLVHYWFSISWFTSAYPLKWLGIDSGIALVIVVLYTTMTATALGLPKVLLLWWVQQRRFTRSLTLWLLPLVWVVVEVFSAVLFTLYSMGPGGTVNGNFTFGMVGYLLAEHTLLLSFASVGGVYLLSAVYVALGVVLWVLCKQRKRICIAAALLLLATAYVPAASPAVDPSIVTIETDFAHAASKDVPSAEERKRVLEEEIIAALESSAAYIVLPEDVGVTQLLGGSQNVFALLDTYRTREVVLVDSMTVPDSESASIYLRAFIYDTQTRMVYTIDKQSLVPQGEFMPYGSTLIMNLIGMGDVAANFSARYAYVPGPQNDRTGFPAHIPGVLFCFEASAPFGVRSATWGGDVPFVAHPVSHAWFNEPHVLWHQLDQMLRVNTRFAGVPLYQAANQFENKVY